MDLNIILWLGGMLFTLSIFAVKVGFGLGFSGMRWKGIFLTLSMYLILFILVAMFSKQLIRLLEPVLRKGPYLHALMALGMIVWGTLLLRNLHPNFSNSQFAICNSQSLLLLIPCPVCLTAITFSTWAALNVIKLPAPLVGLGLGTAFVVLSLLFLTLARLRQSTNPRINLGLCMITIGCYFLASLFIPAKIEETKRIYQSFLADGSNFDVNNNLCVIALLFVAGVIGYLLKACSTYGYVFPLNKGG